jgi:hypothetical protein
MIEIAITSWKVKKNPENETVQLFVDKRIGGDLFQHLC